MEISSHPLGAFVSTGKSCIAPQDCDFLGTKAAQMAIDANISLTDAVVKTASSKPGLNNTHIQNICWVANNEYFRKVARAREDAGEDLTFQFALADPPEVVKMIGALAEPKVAHIDHPDYSMTPAQLLGKESSGGSLGADLGGGTPPSEKRSAIDEVGELRETTQRAAQQALDKLSMHEEHISRLETLLYEQVKEAALSNVPLGHITHLLCQHKEGYSGASQELSKVAHQMAYESPILCHAFSKTAEAVPKGRADLSHPIYETYNDLRILRKQAGQLSNLYKVAQSEASYALQAEQELVHQAIQRGELVLSPETAMQRARGL